MKLLNWLTESNRMLHMAAGFLIMVATVAYMALVTKDLLLIAVTCYWTCTVAGVSVEVKDERWGGKYDWLDAFATVLPSLLFAVGVIISRFI